MVLGATPLSENVGWRMTYQRAAGPTGLLLEVAWHARSSPPKDESGTNSKSLRRLSRHYSDPSPAGTHVLDLAFFFRLSFCQRIGSMESGSNGVRGLL